MRISRLDIVGFKSFADKTRLEFPPGVTAVVGPNGCGKSNISDAIRWVFGEQRMKSLRGGKMEDVIFAGTEARRPMGMAEVQLTLDNADGTLQVPFADVSIGRRYYRNGESEYLINKAPCRRRDVLDLFMDTGVGLDSYSVIEQGKIDMVLSSKPEERRYIFEDAAGIIRYRKRQAEALRKLDRTDQNLARLADTIQEVQRRCRSLKRQASAAQRYRTLQDELRVEELRLARHDYGKASEDLHAGTKRLGEATDALQEVSARVNAGEAAIEEGRTEQLGLEQQLSHAQQRVYAIETDIDRAESHIRVLQEKQAAARERITAAVAELDVLEHRVGELQDQQTRTQEAVAAGEAALSDAADAVVSAERDMTALGEALKQAEAALERERQTSLRVLNDKIAAESSSAAIVGQLEVAAGRLTRIADRIRLSEQHIGVQARRLAEARSRVARLRRERTAAQHALRTAEAERAQGLARRAGVETALAELRELLSATRSKLRSLEDLRDRFEGFQFGVKRVLEAMRDGEAWAHGIRGALVDLVDTDRPHATALEAALGAHVQSIVTATIADADRIIATLNRENGGRITCLPLAGLRSTPWVRAVVPAGGMDGVIGWATDLVRADAAMRPLIHHLLGNTLIVRDAATARRHGSALLPTPRFVTLDGHVIESSGIRSGGAAPEGAGLVGRHNEIVELKEEVTRIEQDVQTRVGEVSELDAQLARVEERVGELSRHGASLDVEIRGLEQDCHRSLEALDQGRADAQHVRSESQALLKERQEFLTAQQMVHRQLQELSIREREVQAQLLSAQSELNDLLDDKDVLTEHLTQLQVERSAAEHALAAHHREAERVVQSLQETEQRVADRRTVVAEAERVIADVDNEVAAKRTQIQERSTEVQQAKADVTQLQDRREALMAELNEREQTLRHSRSEHAALTTQAHEVDMHVARLKDRLEQLRERILQTYHVDLAAEPQLFTEAGEPDQDEIWDPETAAQIVADLKERLEKMGPVNLFAIEEYEEYRARAEFLEQQDRDLKEARSTLLRVIREIGTTIEQRFLDTFAEIQQHFHEVFRVLFEGGRARLTLVDPENPLDCGIDIDVQPPGKQTQSISLFSGGERALTAAALLFAVFMTRPSPFCILDEVDAPLDDQNVLRLCRLIERFSERTQFIVITHNKRTMELADVLYGVTMEERGVSQLVTVEMTREPSEPARAGAAAA